MKYTVPITIRTKNGDKIRFSVTGNSKKKARANGKRFAKRHLKNIEQGFFDGGVFHPIRGSSDYSPSRAGEGKKAKSKSRSRSKSKSKSKRKR